MKILSGRHPSGQLALLFLGTFCVFLALLSFIPLLPPIAAELNISRSNLGWVAGIFMICMAFFQIPFGMMSDRLGRKPMIIGGIFIFSSGLFVTSFAYSFLSLLGARAISGIGAAIFFSTLFTMIGDLYELKERGRAMGIIAIAVGLGTISGYIAGGTLGGEYGWRVVFKALSLIVFLVCAVFFLLEETAEKYRESIHFLKLMSLSLNLFKTRTIVYVTFIAMFCNMASIGATYVLPFFAQDQGISTSTTGLLFVPFAAVSSISASGCGKCSDTIGRKKPLVAVTFVAAVALILFCRMPVDPLSIALNFALVGLCFSPVVTLTSTILVDEVVRTDSSILGTTMSTFNMVRWLGAALGPVIAGVMLDQYGARASLLVLAVLVTGAFVLAVGLREKWE